MGKMPASAGFFLPKFEGGLMSAFGRKSPLNSALTCPIVVSALRPKADAQSARVRIELMSAFPKADIQSVRIGVDLNGCLWPKADIR